MPCPVGQHSSQTGASGQPCLLKVLPSAQSGQPTSRVTLLSGRPQRGQWVFVWRILMATEVSSIPARISLERRLYFDSTQGVCAAGSSLRSGPPLKAAPNFGVLCDYGRILRTSAPVAQLDRASGYEPEGREFESLRARHSKTCPHSCLGHLLNQSAQRFVAQVAQLRKNPAQHGHTIPAATLRLFPILPRRSRSRSVLSGRAKAL